LKLGRREKAVAEEVKKISAAYEKALTFEIDKLDPEDAKQREALAKVGEEVAKANKNAKIPTWAYYALGVSTVVLPRLFVGAL
jgi:hypothetical protein